MPDLPIVGDKLRGIVPFPVDPKARQVTAVMLLHLRNAMSNHHHSDKFETCQSLGSSPFIGEIAKHMLDLRFTGFTSEPTSALDTVEFPIALVDQVLIVTTGIK